MTSQAVKNAVGALCSLSPDQLLPRLMSHVTEGLSRPALRQVTKEEYAIMLTPAGELYDDSIMQRYASKSRPRSSYVAVCVMSCPVVACDVAAAPRRRAGRAT